MLPLVAMPCSTIHRGYNTAIGSSALYSNTDGYENAANGYQALYNNTSGIFNTAIGTNTLFRIL